MSPKNKKQKVAPPPKMTSASAQPPQSQGTSNYKHLLNTYLTYPGGIKPKDLAGWADSDKAFVLKKLGKLSMKTVPADPNQKAIIDEISRKFLDNNEIGLNNTYYEKGGANSISSYRPDAYAEGELRMVPAYNKKEGPNPLTVAHELMHANDHQSRLPQDHLTPKIWERLRDVAQGKTFKDFSDATSRMQAKLSADFNSPIYSLDDAYITKEIKDANGLGGDDQYTTPMQGIIPDWKDIFDKIKKVTTHVEPGYSVQNPFFYLSRASEFPTFMMENLRRPWGIGKGNSALPIEEAQGMYGMLKDIGESYTEPDAPIMNSYIRARRHSILDGYDPAYAAHVAPLVQNTQAALGAPVAPSDPAWAWARGGRVTRKNLLSRFIKPKRKAS